MLEYLSLKGHFSQLQLAFLFGQPLLDSLRGAVVEFFEGNCSLFPGA